MFDFRFRGPTTDKAYGFSYKESKTMELDYSSYTGRDKQGLPVDLIVEPSLVVWGNHSIPVEDWHPEEVHNLVKMSVVVDMTLY